MFETRPGEIRLDADPATSFPDAHIVFIGTVRSPWKNRSECPKNLRQARERNQTATVSVHPRFLPGLSGLEPGSPVILFTWLNFAPRDLIVQNPRHSKEPCGAFALRSPARPNPVGLHVVRLLTLEENAGLLEIDAIDVLDGTPLIDIKPWFESTDIATER